MSEVKYENRFEVKEEFKDCAKLPIRGTDYSAGYDIASAEDIIVPSIWKQIFSVLESVEMISETKAMTIEEITKFNKEHGISATLIETGLTYFTDNPRGYLDMAPRSSVSTGALLIMPNTPGTIDKDFYPKAMKVPIINLAPFDILVKKGDRIAQGIISEFDYTTDETETRVGKRTGGLGSTKLD